MGQAWPISNVFYCGEDHTYNTESTYFYAGHCGSGHSWFGEEVKLVRVTAQHLVFRGVKSGVEVKTKRDNLHRVVGKAAEDRLRKREALESIVSFDERHSLLHASSKRRKRSRDGRRVLGNAFDRLGERKALRFAPFLECTP